MISTCSIALADPGRCCKDECALPAAVAVLVTVGESDFMEHTYCLADTMAADNVAATKPLRFRSEVT